MRKTIALTTAGLFLVIGVFCSSGAVQAQSAQGQTIYSDHCAMCHGRDGKGNGPASSAFSPSPADFTNPSFWQGDVNQKITGTIEDGHGPMPSFELSPEQIKAVISYMTQTFKPGS